MQAIIGAGSCNERLFENRNHDFPECELNKQKTDYHPRVAPEDAFQLFPEIQRRII
jgi:hypothetical protein